MGGGVAHTIILCKVIATERIPCRKREGKHTCLKWVLEDEEIGLEWPFANLCLLAEVKMLCEGAVGSKAGEKPVMCLYLMQWVIQNSD